MIKLVDEVSKRQYESYKVELKSAREGNPRKFYDTLSSFSNTAGGIIIFGIDEKNNYEICGVKDIKEMQKIIQEVSKDMEPVVRPIITPLEYKPGVNLLIVEVSEMDFLEKPCYYKPLGIMKGSFIRTGDGDELMSEFEIFQFQMFKKQSQTELETFDNTSFENDIDAIKLDAYIAKAIENKPNFTNLPKKTIIEMLGLSRNNKPTLVALLLFGKYPQSVAPLLTVNCIKVKGTEYISSNNVNERFIANESISGTIPQMFSLALRFIISNTQKTTIIDENGQRNDKNEYPITAIREVLMNALLHRDYSYMVRSIPISVVIYDNRIEISNPGSILGNYKVEDLGKEYLPIRNVFLCRNTEDLLETENRHSGVLTAIEDMKRNDLLPPLFESNRGFFKATLYNRRIDDYKNKNFINEILQYCYIPKSKGAIASHFGYQENKSTYFYNVFIKPLINDGILFLTIPSSPASKYQKITSNKKELA